MRSIRPHTVAVLAAFTLCAAGCNRTAPAPATDGGQSEPVAVWLRLSRESATVGEPIEATVEAVSPPASSATIADPPADLGAFTLRGATTSRAELKDGRRVTTRTFTLVGLDPGEHDIPPLEVSFRGEGEAEPTTLSTAPATVRIDTLIEGTFDPQEYADVKPEAVLPVPARWPWFVAGSVLAAAVVAAIVAATLRARRQPPPPVPSHVWALAELDRLEASGAVDAGGRSFVVPLTDILRTYIERRFEVMAPEQTTDEFLRIAQTHPALAAEHSSMLAGLLRAADLVKFARQDAPREACSAALASTRGFVRRTAVDAAGATP
ncbi:MAG: hypothetical protein KDA22_00995 [Phycisphaerales bacterium]|nr:hypothetical protein [Phycisphaerales bacterium]